MYITNAFSLNMIGSFQTEISVVELNKEAVQRLASIGLLQSAIGHADTAAVISDDLHYSFDMNRVSIKLGEDEPVIVAQYVGPRLPEGSTTLPEGAEIKYIAICWGSTLTPLRAISKKLRALAEENPVFNQLALNWHKSARKED